MLTKIQKWGNSLALRIPKSFAADARIEQDTLVELSLVDGQIIVKPVEAPKWTLAQLLDGITSQNLHAEIDAGDAVGNETW
jgi:antitoxin MazE